MSKIAYGLWKNTSSEVGHDLSRIAQNLTKHYFKLANNSADTFYESNSKEVLFDLADKENADWCLLIKPGVLLKSKDIDLISKIIDQEFFGKSENEIKESPVMLVNINSWKNGNMNIFRNVEAENILNLEIDKNSTSLESIFKNFENTDLYKWSLALKQKESLEEITNSIGGGTNKLFVFNTESFDDIKFSRKLEKLDYLYSLAAGTKDLYILKHHGFNEKTKLIYFDISDFALSYRKYLWNKWEGLGYPEFIKSSLDQISQWSGEKNLSNCAFEKSKIEELYSIEMKQWENDEEFENTFKRLDGNTKIFLKVDIVKEYSKIIAHIKNNVEDGSKIAIWYSNCFNYTSVLARLNWDLELMTKSGQSFLEEISRLKTDKNLEIVIYGEKIHTGSW